MFRVLVLFLAGLLLLRLLGRLLAGVMEGLSGREPSARRARGGAAVPLVRDPVCGTYVVKATALAAVADGQTTWFCSERCRDSWRASHAGSRIA